MTDEELNTALFSTITPHFVILLICFLIDFPMMIHYNI